MTTEPRSDLPSSDPSQPDAPEPDASPQDPDTAQPDIRPSGDNPTIDVDRDEG